MKKTLLILLAALLGIGPTAVTVSAAADIKSAVNAEPALNDQEDRDHERWTILIPELFAGLFVSGTVTSLDLEKGIVGLNTDVQGDIELQIRPDMLQKADLSVGDIAVVNLGYSIDQRTISAESCEMLPIKVASC